MNSWHTFLTHSGATFTSTDTNGHQQVDLAFTEELSNASEQKNQRPIITPLVQLGVLAVTGQGARKFLQGQITCDIDRLSAEHSLLGARCNIKGRALTNFFLCQRDEETLLMVMDRFLVESSISELSKYAAFFKVALDNVSDDHHCLGLYEEPLTTDTAIVKASQQLTDQFTSFPTFNYQDGRRLLLVPDKDVQQLWSQLVTVYQPSDTNFWRLKDIQAGIAILNQATAGLFIPQMFNFQDVDGISFKKGCYTGQEVIARMKYLGKLKRKMYRIELSASDRILAISGASCYIPDYRQSIGNIISAAYADNSKQEALVVLTDEAACSNSLIIGESDHRDIVYLPFL